MDLLRTLQMLRTFDKQSVDKTAIYVERGGPISRWSAATLGRLNPLSLPVLIASGRAYHSPDIKGREKAHEETAEDIASAEPEALKDTVVRLGGTDLIDDILWKKERGGRKLPWHKRLGGRVLHNPRSGILGKILGYPQATLGSTIMPLIRGTHYNANTDAVAQFMDEPVVTQHELGHAIDFNRFPRGGEVAKTFLGRQGHGLRRDLYGMAYMVPFVKLVHEARANTKSRKALLKAWKLAGKDPKEFRKIMKRRAEVLPSAYASYVASAIMPQMVIPAMAAGKGIGVGLSQNDAYIDTLMQGLERQDKKKSEKKTTKKSAMDKASAGAGMLFLRQLFRSFRGSERYELDELIDNVVRAKDDSYTDPAATTAPEILDSILPLMPDAAHH